MSGRNNESRFAAPLMPDDLRNQLMAASLQQQTQASYQVPTEVVELPSKGLFYPEGHPLHSVETVEIKFMTTKEEDEIKIICHTKNHEDILFFTNKGRVYRAKVHELPDAGRDARGQHVANLMAFKPDESIAAVLSIKDYTAAPYLVLSTKSGLVKKSPLTEYDSPRTGGLIAISLRDGDEVVGATLATDKDELLLVSRKGMSLRFSANNDSIRSMGRSATGVIGMKFRAGDELLAMARVGGSDKNLFVFTATDGGFGKKSPLDEYRIQNRGGIGIKAAKVNEDRGGLVGALVISDKDEILAITSNGSVMRTDAAEIRQTGRDSMGVRLVNLDEGVTLLSVTKNGEDADTVTPA